MAQYSTGTVAVGQGSATVAGSGTGWVAAGVAGWSFVGPDGRTYGVASVASATGLTLDRAYEGRTATAQAYALVEGQPAAGAASVPWPGDASDNISRPSAGQIALRTGGVQRALLGTTAFTLSVPVQGAAVIQGDYDTTPGRLMTAGAAGLNKAPGNYPAEYAFNQFVNATGFYWFNNVGDAGPTGLGYGSVIALNYAASRQHRIVLDADAARMFIGYVDSTNTESAWRELLTDARLTQTTTDTAVGRILKVSDAGILGTAPYWLGNANDIPFGATVSSGQITEQQAITNNWPTIPGALTTSLRWFVLRSGGEPNRQVQEATEIFGSASPSKGRTYRRSKHDTTWTSWRLVYDQATILGTVSQTGGVPDGAIIETGANANGRYTKFADGTMFCWGAEQPATASTASGAIFTSPTLTFVFPAAFATAPTGVGGNVAPSSRWTSGGAAQWAGTVADVTAGQFVCRLLAAVTGSVSAVSYIAAGRCF